jgi:hypothetical protein
VGEKTKSPLQLSFNPSLRVDFEGFSGHYENCFTLSANRGWVYNRSRF